MSDWQYAMDEAKEKFNGHYDGAREAFDELCAMVDAMLVRRHEEKLERNFRRWWVSF